MKWNSISILNSNNILQTQHIDRIGNEGATIKYYSTNALCIPGRAALLSGKYGHLTNTIANNFINDTIKLLPEILHDNGYFTALCGKWMLTYPLPHPPYFDYWLYTHDKVNYYNDTCYYYDSVLVSNSHITELLTDTVEQFIMRIDTPFFIMLNHNAPHKTWNPQPQFNGMFDSLYFDIPCNFAKFTKNYPSFLYEENYNLINTISEEQIRLRNYYEMMAGIDESVGRVLFALDQRGVLDNTLILFTTDNSNLIGEHGLQGKQYPYEECMRMPLLIRYPAMFQANTLINDNFILNIDIAPTILKLTGIADSFQMQGIPIQNFISGLSERQEFLYEQKAKYPDTFPQARTFRDYTFQYNRYYCSDTTEELFDMLIDPLQKINLINNAEHKSILIQYRNKLDSLQLAFNDTSAILSSNCYLKNPYFTTNIDSGDLENIKAEFAIYPNPANEYLNLVSQSHVSGTVDIYNALGKIVKTFDFKLIPNEKTILKISELSSGFYFLRLSNSSGNNYLSFVKS